MTSRLLTPHGPAAAASWFGRRTPARQGSSAMWQGAFQLSPAAGVTAVMAWRRVLQARVEQLCHRTNMGAAWRQPGRSPRQRPPAVTIMGRCVSGSAALHRPLGPPQPVQLRRQRPSAVLQILQVAVAVERPPLDLARPTAPNRRSGGCTDGGRRASASRCSGGPCRSPSRARWRSPRAGASSGASRGLTALGLVARLHPTHRAGGHGQAGAVSRLHRTPRR